ncbi:MAG TPA: hypothetical protein VGI88_12135 [Verrucomicrobiae bacterium]|jgi:hypothetical protein
MAEHPVETSPNRINESVACDVCGHFGAIEFGDCLLCPDCYQNCGSCCSAEFGQKEAED